MSNQNDVYNEKKLGTYGGTFRTGMLSKPLDVNVTVTPNNVYGLAYIMEQAGIRESDPVYSRFIVNLGEITKVYTNDSVKANPLYIQCDITNKSTLIRKRVIVPCLDNPSAVMKQILEAKEKYDEKMEKVKEREKAQKEKKSEQSISAAAAAPAPAAETAAAESKADVSEEMHKKADEMFDSARKSGTGNGSDLGFKPVPKRKQKVSIDELIKINNSIEIEITPPPTIKKGDIVVSSASGIGETSEAPAAEETAAVYEEPAVSEAPVAAETEEAVYEEPAQTSEFEAIDTTAYEYSETGELVEPPVTGGVKTADELLQELGLTEMGGEPIFEKNSFAAEEISDIDKSDIALEEIAADGMEALDETPYTEATEEEINSAAEAALTGFTYQTEETAAPVETVYEEAPEAEEVVAEITDTDEVVESAEAVAAEDAYLDNSAVAVLEAEDIPEPETTEPAPEVNDVHIDFSSETKKDTSLDDFQEAVKALKAKLDEGIITAEEFKAEKKELLRKLH